MIKRPSMGMWLAVCLLWVTPPMPASAQAPSPAGQSSAPGEDLSARLEALCDTIEKRRVEQHIPSLAIAIVKDDRIVLARGFGVRDLATGQAADERTLYAIGSQTKAFTSMLISMYADEGALSWDEPVRTYVPGFKLFDAEADRQATLRDLCSHRTGLPRTDLLWASGKATKQQMMERLAFAEPTFKFRERWQYNNTMFMVAGMAAEAAGKATWHELVRSRIFTPLSMHDSNTHIRDMQASPRAAKGYQWDQDKGEHRFLPMREVTCDGAGAINSTAIDMAQWLRMLLSRGTIDGRRVVSEQMIDLMWTRQIDVSPGAGYGLGWMVGEWNGKRQVDHGGNIDGFFTSCAMLPDDKLGFVLMGTLTYAPLQGECLPMVWNTFFPPAADAGSPFKPEELQEYLGRYRADLLGIDCTVNLKNGRLHFDVPGQMNYELNWPDDAGKWAFTMIPQAIQLKFNRNAQGRIVSVSSFQNGAELVCPRLDSDGKPVEAPAAAASLPRDQLVEYTGAYHFGPTNDTWKVILKDGTIAVDVPRQRAFELLPPDDRGVWKVAAAPAMMSCRFDRDDLGKIVAMTWIQGGEIKLPRTADGTEERLPTIEELCELRRASADPDKIKAMGDIEFAGKVRCVNQGVEGTLTARVNADGRLYQGIEFGVFGFIRTAYDGQHAWTHSVGEEFTELTGERLDEVRKAGAQYLVTDLRALFDTVEVIDRATVDGTQTIVVTGKTSRPEKTVRQYLDPKTGLAVKEETTAIVPSIGRIPMTVWYREYESVGGVQFPRNITVSNDANGSIVMTLERITPNARVGAEGYRMSPPSDVK